MSKQYRSWTPHEAATAAQMWQAMDGRPQVERVAAIAKALGRTYGSVDGRRNAHGALFDVTFYTNHINPPMRVPDHVIDERDTTLSKLPRDLTAALMGDPLPGRSALERRV